MIIKYATEQEILKFLSISPKSQKTFTYFQKRPINIIKNHIVTLLGYDTKNTAICYGHLDPHNNDIWLGICVADEYHSKGYGTKMVEALIKQAISKDILRLSLSVQKTNTVARNLYKSLGFIEEKEDQTNQYMVLHLWEIQ
jgi:RimJ/RimL family protein N-acetyltransferase